MHRTTFTSVTPLDDGFSKHRELQGRHAPALRGIFEGKTAKTGFDEEEEASGHGHHEKPPSVVTAVAAAIINYLLMFGLCCAYGMIIFADDHHEGHRALGVKMTLSTAFIMGLLLAGTSGIPVAVGGTDLNPVVFLGGFVETMSAQIAADLGLELPSGGYSSRLLREEGRWLGGSSSSTSSFCTGSHLELNRDSCGQYHEQLRATTIFTVAVTSAMLGLTYFCLGRFRLTRYVNYMPTSITEAFLSCIGYKVFKYALKFCNYDVKQFMPAACIGVPLYFLKAMHVGNPAIVIPLVLLIPLALFYSLLYIAGSDIDQAREDGFMFPIMENVPFYTIWTDSVFKADKISISAWTKTLPDMAIMLVVCVLDCVLKISATEQKMPVKVHTDYEIMLHGLGNVVVVCFGSAVGYMQLKFNVIAYGVMGNTKDRRAGVLYAVLCGVCFFGTIAHFNYLPRFFLGTMLFFAGAGFVAENLWGSRKYLSFPEWIEILTILGIFIITGELLPAVIIGGLLCGMSFIVKYARVPAIAGRPMTGKEVTTRERPTSMLVHKNVQHITDSWLMVVRLKGFIFFASAHAVIGYVRMRMDTEEREGVPKYRRLHFVTFDCELLDGMDASGAKAVLKLVMECRSRGVRVLWSSVDPNFIDELKTRDILRSNDDWFIDLNQAVHHVESHALKFRRAQQEKWLKLHQIFERNSELIHSNLAFEPFKHVLLTDGARIGCPWRYCSAVEIKQYRTVLFESGKQNGNLYLVHSGTVALFERIPSNGDDEWTAPLAIYGHGWFLNREALIRAPSKHVAIAIVDGEVVSWNRDQWWLMVCEQPMMALELQRAVMKQQGRDNEREWTSVDHLPVDMDDQEWLEFGDTVETMDDDADPADVPHTSSKVMPRSGTLSLGANLTLQIGPRRNKLLRRGATMVAETNVTRSWKSSIDPKKKRFTAAKAQDADVMMTMSRQRTASMSSSLPSRSVSVTGQGSSLRLPEELQLRMLALQSAQALGGMRFYDTPRTGEALFLPDLPPLFAADLELAFNTYCCRQGEEHVVLRAKAAEALMYVGIFNRLIEPPQGALKLGDFMTYGHEAVFAHLTESQRSTLRAVFEKHNTDESGKLRMTDLSAAFRSLLKLDIHENEVEYIARCWLSGPCGRLDVEAFSAIVSWYVKKHQHDWHLLCGFREVLGVTAESRITAATMKPELLIPAGLEQEEAEEMLWSADWLLNGKGEGKELSFGGFLSAVSMSFDRSVDCKLPPAPRRPVEVQTPQPPPLEDQRMLELSKEQAEVCGNEVQHFGTKSEDIRNFSRVPKAQKSTSSRRARLYLLLEVPESSREASFLSGCVFVLILLSCICMVLEPLISGTDETAWSQKEHDVWLGLELSFTVLFTIELLLRLCVVDALQTNTYLGFIMTPRNICDFIAIVPAYVELILGSQLRGLRLLRIIRLARLGRLARIGRLSSKIPLAAPVSVVLVVIWGIYLLHHV